jgi:hypothetical protein
MFRRGTIALILGAALGTATPTRAGGATGASDPPDPSDRAERRVPAEPPETHKEGDYGGVTPGEAPAAKKARREPAGTLTWVGFSAKDDGGAELFFRATSEFSASQRIEGGALVVSLEGIKRLKRNTRRPLDTRFFETPVARVTVKAVSARRGTKKLAARKSGIEVRLAFKKGDAREGSLRTATEPDGSYTVYLDLGSGGASADARAE